MHLSNFQNVYNIDGLVCIRLTQISQMMRVSYVTIKTWNNAESTVNVPTW